MIEVPVSTVEKPLTVIDYIAAMCAQCNTATQISRFSEQIPESVRNDERFARAVAAHLVELKRRRARA